MNEKLLKVAKREGYCCMWAFLEANKMTYTSDLVKLAKADGFPMTARAIRHQRRAYRNKKIVCEGRTDCLRQRIKDGHKIP